MMDKLALEMETFEEILERFEVDVAQAKQCGDYSQMVSKGLRSVLLESFWFAAHMEGRHTRRLYISIFEVQALSFPTRISDNTDFRFGSPLAGINY